MFSHLKEATVYAFKKLGRFLYSIGFGFSAFGTWLKEVNGIEKVFVIGLIIFVLVQLFF